MVKNPFPIRLKEENMDKIKELAKKQDRSINYIINKLVEIALKDLSK